MPNFSKDDLLKIASSIFCAAGAVDDIAQQVSEVLVLNNMAGHDSHGVLRIPGYLKNIETGEIVPNARPEILSESVTTALVGGNWAFGQLTGLYAVDLAISKAKKNQVSVVAAVQAGHTGRLAAFTDRAAKQGVVMFMTIGTTMQPVTAPYGGSTAVMGTNPMAFSLPHQGGAPISLDFATSAIAAGKIKVAQANQENLPPNSILDKYGRPSIDPQDFIDGGVLLPFGGHKGYGLALIAELLSGPLIGSEKFPGIKTKNGIFIFAFDAEIFRPAGEYEKSLEEVLGRIKSVPPREGFKEVLLPGERGVRSAERREQDGIPVAESTWKAIYLAAKSVGVNL